MFGAGLEEPSERFDRLLVSAKSHLSVSQVLPGQSMAFVQFEHLTVQICRILIPAQCGQGDAMVNEKVWVS